MGLVYAFLLQPKPVHMKHESKCQTKHLNRLHHFTPQQPLDTDNLLLCPLPPSLPLRSLRFGRFQLVFASSPFLVRVGGDDDQYCRGKTMDAFRKQASKLRDQVAKQQQAVIKHISGSGYESSDVMVLDEVELQRHHQLEKLYRSTRSKRDFQKEIVKAAETFTAIGYRKIEADNKLSEDCCKYGSENTDDDLLAKSASIYGDACKHIAKEQEELNRLIMSQVLDPFRAMVTSAPLEDARHLAQRYSRMRQEAETQQAEISRRNQRVREAPTQENVGKLHAAEARMQELRANMAVLGKEAAAALAAVESQQERLTFQRLVALVEGEKNFYVRLATILGEVEAEMVSEKQQKEAAPPVFPAENTTGKTTYFLAEAIHSFDADTEKELSLSVGDFVVVRKVSPSGWSEGECKGRAGWFPSAYVEKRQRIPSRNGSADVY